MIKACLKLYPNGNEKVELLWLRTAGKQFREGLYDLVLNLSEKTVLRNNLVTFSESERNNYSVLSDYLKNGFPDVNFSYYENNMNIPDIEYSKIDSTFPIIRKV